MRVAFIDKKGVELKVEYKSLKIDEKKIPLRLLDTVVLGSACALESKDILKMTKEGISLLLVSAKSDDMAIVFSAKSKSAELKMELFRADINEFVFSLFDRELLKKSDFTTKNGLYLRYDSRRKVWGYFKPFNEKLQKKLDKEITLLREMIKETNG